MFPAAPATTHRPISLTIALPLPHRSGEVSYNNSKNKPQLTHTLISTRQATLVFVRLSPTSILTHSHTSAHTHRYGNLLKSLTEKLHTHRHTYTVCSSSALRLFVYLLVCLCLFTPRRSDAAPAFTYASSSSDCRWEAEKQAEMAKVASRSYTHSHTQYVSMGNR